MILGKIIDTMTAGQSATIAMVILYFLLTALTGFTEAAREGLLTVFGQKITHTLRSRLMAKQIRLTADALNHQEPGALVSRFVGDVDTVESLFTSGIVSMFADPCRIISILAVIWLKIAVLRWCCWYCCRFCSGSPGMCRRICSQHSWKTAKQ